MKKTLVLLAGYPGTGKSYLCSMILKMENRFFILSPDEIKEKFWDEYGFDDETEKQNDIAMSWQYYYKKMEECMQDDISIISDYPFSIKQKAALQERIEKYDYQVVTIRLLADLDILFERQRKRDLDDQRHLGHILSAYHKGDVLKDRYKADSLVTRAEFVNRCRTRGYDTFCLGYLIELNVSDFSQADYSGAMEKLALLIK